MRPRSAVPSVRAAAGLSVLLLTACSGDADPADPRAAPAGSAAPLTSPGPAATATPPPAAGASGDGERVRAVLDGVELSLEVADERSERAVGLMHRTEVPPGTGMVFLYDEPSEGRFYMFNVPVPLRAVFVRDGRVVSSVLMPPCEEPVAEDCETYGADGPYDTVVETAPETLPDVQPGDVLELQG